MKTFLKTKFYPVNYNTKEIIDLPFNRERNVSIMFRKTGFIGIKGRRLNKHCCYKKFIIKPGDFKITEKN